MCVCGGGVVVSRPSLHWWLLKSRTSNDSAADPPGPAQQHRSNAGQGIDSRVAWYVTGTGIMAWYG